MKKLSLYCLAGLLLPLLYLSPISTKPVTSAENTTSLETQNLVTEISDPAKDTPDLSLTYVKLDETEPWILDEIVSDYVSEDVVELEDKGIAYTIGEWIDRDTHTCLYFNKELPGGTVYTVAGYAKTTDGSYVYFELTSPERITEQQVDLEITRTFGNTGVSKLQTC